MKQQVVNRTLGSGLIDSPNDCCGESNCSKEDVGASVISRCDASPVFEASEHILDFMPVSVEGFIVRDLDLAMFERRNAGLDSLCYQGSSEPSLSYLLSASSVSAAGKCLSKRPAPR